MSCLKRFWSSDFISATALLAHRWRTLFIPPTSKIPSPILPNPFSMRGASLFYTLISVLILKVHSGMIRYCDASIFGHPVAADCIDALMWIPTASDVPDLFLEPQLRGVRSGRTHWPGSCLPFAHSKFVQLPKIWTLRSCTIALLAYEDQYHTSTALVITSKAVERSVFRLIHDCPVMGRTGGVEAMPDRNARPGILVYIFDSNSHFNSALNRYQSTDFQKAIQPLNPLSTLHQSENIGWRNSTEPADWGIPPTSKVGEKTRPDWHR